LLCTSPPYRTTIMLEYSLFTKIEDVKRQDPHPDPSAWEEVIGPWVESRTSVSISEVLEKCLQKEQALWTQTDKNQVARCLRAVQRCAFQRNPQGRAVTQTLVTQRDRRLRRFHRGSPFLPGAPDTPRWIEWIPETAGRSAPRRPAHLASHRDHSGIDLRHQPVGLFALVVAAQNPVAQGSSIAPSSPQTPAETRLSSRDFGISAGYQML